MSSAPAAARPWGESSRNVNDNSKAPSAASTQTSSTSSLVPSKRLDDDVQFISSQPVKKQKLTQTKLQIKITPPPASRFHLEQQPQQQSQLDARPASQFSPIIVPTIQLTPASSMQGGDDEPSEAATFPQERRVSTGMVGLPSDFHEIKAAYAMRGVSLPISACLDNFVLNQPVGRPRPMSSPPLSPKQLPPTMSMSVLHDNTTPVNMLGFQGYSPSVTNIPGHGSLGGLVAAPAPLPTGTRNSTFIVNRPMTPTSSPSPVQMATFKKPVSSMPSPIPTQTMQHREQSPDRMKQTHPFPSQQIPTTPPTINRPAGPKPPCQACVVQRAMMARAQGLPMSMTNLQKMPTNTIPQMRCPPIHLYPRPHLQLTTTQGPSPDFYPMMMPMHVNSYHGMAQQQGGLPHHHQPVSPVQHYSMPIPTLPATPHLAGQGELPQTAPATPTSCPAAPASSYTPHPALQSTHRKPARNLIVDIAETCQEKFPFEEVAKRQDVPVDKVIEVFTAIVGVPLLRSANDRRRPGKLATSRIREYQKAKKEIQKERAHGGTDGEAGINQDEIVVRPLEVAQRLGPVEMAEDL